MSEWDFLTLEEAGIQLLDCVHKTPAAQATGLPYVAIPQLQKGEIELSDARRISVADFEEWTKKADPQPFDMVLSRRCNPGETAYVRPGQRFALGQNLVLLRASGMRVRPTFLRWMVRSPYWWAEIKKFINVGAVFDSLRCADVPRFSLPVPPISHQDAISALLGALDDKIALNRQMNKTLEAMARSIFKDWFVDFGPVRAKTEGGAPYLLSDLWSLFPDKLDDDDKPVGWRSGRLEDVANPAGQSVKPDELSPDTPYIGLEHMPRRSISLDSWEGAGKVTSGKLAFRRGDFLFGKLRPYFHKVGIAPVDGICSTDIVVLKAKKAMGSAFVISCISMDEFVDYTDRSSAGTKMPRTSWALMARYELPLPPDELMKAFQDSVSPLLERVVDNIHELRTLAALRDLLLPKLMSGEIRLKDAEQALEAVA
jgi:type I restriction enzyme S subunit